MRGAVLVVLVGCANHTYHCPAGLHLVRTCTSPSEYLVYRDGAGPWQKPVAESSSVADLCVTNDYELIHAADQSVGTGSGFYAFETASTVAETSTTELQCADPTVTSTVNISGEMLQPGAVCIGNVCHDGQGTPWSFSIPVSSGTHDLIALSPVNSSTPGTMLIKRRQDFSKATTVPNIDLGGAAAMDQLALTLSGTVAGETFSTMVELFTSTSWAVLTQTNGTMANVAPPSLLEASDQQQLSVSGLQHGVTVTFTGSETSFSLLPPLTGVTLMTAPLEATWTSIPIADYTGAGLGITALPSFSVQGVSASRGWIDAHAATSLAFDSSPPDYNPAWNVDTSAAFQANFSVSIDTPTMSLWSSLAPVQHQAVARMAKRFPVALVAE